MAADNGEVTNLASEGEAVSAAGNVGTATCLSD